MVLVRHNQMEAPDQDRYRVKCRGLHQGQEIAYLQ
jgi:hypothetical protein